MINRITERINLYSHAAACHAISVNQFGKDSEQSKFRADIHAKAEMLLSVEIQAHIDYTRAVIAERDAILARAGEYWNSAGLQIKYDIEEYLLKGDYKRDH